MNVPDLKDVLAEVNRLRAERGMEPLDEMPKGVRCVPGRCMIARALCAYVRPLYECRDPRNQWGNLRGVDGEPLPLILSDASYAFDDGRYPELVA